MVYYTGDIHGSKDSVSRFCQNMSLGSSDIVVLLGDVGANYYGNVRDLELKQALAELKPTFLCIHGNHEIRPSTIPSYTEKSWNGGIVWYEESYPNILFAKDGEIFDLEGLKHIVIGGAYSIDKYYRLSHGYGWWEDEQPTDEIKNYVETKINILDVNYMMN